MSDEKIPIPGWKQSLVCTECIICGQSFRKKNAKDNICPNCCSKEEKNNICPSCGQKIKNKKKHD